MDKVINHPFFTRFQSNQPDTKNNSISNLIFTGNNQVMKKSFFDIKPIQPPKYKVNQIDKIDAIKCPENYNFQGNIKHRTCSTYRHSFIGDNI